MAPGLEVVVEEPRQDLAILTDPLGAAGRGLRPFREAARRGPGLAGDGHRVTEPARGFRPRLGHRSVVDHRGLERQAEKFRDRPCVAIRIAHEVLVAHPLNGNRGLAQESRDRRDVALEQRIVGVGHAVVAVEE